jgi:hypothetical protein
MDYGKDYSIYELAKATEFYLTLLDKMDLQFFVHGNILYDRAEIMKTIQIGRQIKLQNEQVPIISHPAIHLAIINQEFYKAKVEGTNNSEEEILSIQLYTNINWLVSAMIDLIYDVYIKTIEIKLNGKQYIDALKFLTVEKQKDYNYTHPIKFVKKYKEYLDKRVSDFKELVEIDKLNFGVELKDIMRSYKLGLEINVKGRNLLTPLLEKNYELFIENLRDTLIIPSYYDAYKKEKERYYHIYLLGVLEGRLNFYKIQSNKESGFGRYDICGIPLLKSNPGFIIEVKADDTVSEKDAIEQVKSNKYLTELKNEGVKESMILAVNFKGREIFMEHEIIRFE